MSEIHDIDEECKEELERETSKNFISLPQKFQTTIPSLGL